MSDFNRKQFEKYAKSKGWEDRHLKQRDDGGYEDWGVHPIWLSWQASRECLVIELPEPRVARGYGEQVAEALGFNDAINYCEEAIHAAGVKTK